MHAYELIVLKMKRLCKLQRRGRQRMVVGFTTTCAISVYHHHNNMLNLPHGGMYTMQHFVIKFVSDLRQAGGFFRTFRSPPSITLSVTI